MMSNDVFRKLQPKVEVLFFSAFLGLVLFWIARNSDENGLRLFARAVEASIPIAAVGFWPLALVIAPLRFWLFSAAFFASIAILLFFTFLSMLGRWDPVLFEATWAALTPGLLIHGPISTALSLIGWSSGHRAGKPVALPKPAADTTGKGGELLRKEWQEMLETSLEGYRKYFTEKDRHPLIPPWLEFPDIPRASIGWRMGAGEGYMDYFKARYSGMTGDERQIYRKKHPEPHDWQEFYVNIETQVGRQAGPDSN